jgi:hypothetical protein
MELNRPSRPSLGRLTKVDARSIWQHEARDFTPWLLENGDLLAEVLGIELDLQLAEHPVGGFSLDLLGTDLTNSCPLIVENQLEPSDHSHLGQLLTYAAGTGAGTVVWITPTFREEHQQAIEWLNEHTDESIRFFGLRVEVLRIGSSEPAVQFSMIAQPNDYQRGLRTVASEARAGGRGIVYKAFWEKLLERLHNEHPGWTRARKAQAQNWMTLRSVPHRGGMINASFGGGGLRTEIYLDSGDGGRNAAVFSAFLAHRGDIEAVFGRELHWDEMEGRRACRISDEGVGNVGNDSEHGSYLDWFVDSFGRWIRVLEELGRIAGRLAE